jgi:hypothetical protein
MHSICLKATKLQIPMKILNMISGTVIMSNQKVQKSVNTGTISLANRVIKRGKAQKSVSLPCSTFTSPQLTSRWRDDGFIETRCPSSRHSLKPALPGLSLALLNDQPTDDSQPFTAKKLFYRTVAVTDWLDRQERKYSSVTCPPFTRFTLTSCHLFTFEGVSKSFRTESITK